MLFKIEIMVEDRDLGKALRQLDGIAVGAPTCVPVRGAETKMVMGKREVRSSMPLVGQTMMANIRHMLIQRPSDTITSAEIKQLALSVGASEHTAKSAAFHLMRSGNLTKPINQAPVNFKGRSWQRTYRIVKPEGQVSL